MSRDMRYGMAPVRRMNPMGKRELSGTWNRRSIRFDFEQNEEEDRAIADAIAKQEEIMRLEDEEIKRGIMPGHYSEVGSPSWNEDSFLSTSSNLVVLPSDDADTQSIKNMLETMIVQVCKWDRMYGWSRGPMKGTIKKRIEADPHVNWMRRSMNKQQEHALMDRMDHVKREVNKRRVVLECEAETELGVNAPWKKNRGRPNKMSRRHSPHISHGGRALDPSEISLGSPSQLAPRSPKKRRDSERTLGSRKEEGWDSIADRVRRRERTSESDQSSVKRERRVKVELPDTHVPSPSSQENEDKCFCGKAYNPKKQYLQCVVCSHHHHLRCLQLSEKKARKMVSTWVCHSCQDTKKEEETETELYCLCQTPYDDSKFYVGCDKCEGWYHPKCVNITQEEAETVAEYICPLCMGVSKKEEEEEGMEGGSSQREETSHSYSRHKRTTSMSTTFSASLHLPRDLRTLGRSDFSILRTLIEGIFNEALAAPFRYPVDTNEYPDYTQVNPHPMDLSEIRRKIDQLEYRQLDDLSKDFHLMLENARRYNADGSQIYHDTFLLEVLFEKKKEESIRAMEQKRRKMRKQSECGTVDSCLDIDTDQLMHTFVDPSILEGLQF